MKFKKIVVCILFAVLMFANSTNQVSASDNGVKVKVVATEKEGDFYYQILNDGTIKIVSYNRTELPDTVTPDWVKIPSQIAGLDVTCIGSGAFQSCSGVTDIEIPEGVTTIESYAFAGSEAAVTIPSSIKYIGSWAFSGCSYVYVMGSDDALGTLTIPQGVTQIEEEAFSNCTWLIEVVIPSSVISIGDKAFYNCTELTYVSIPTNVTVGQDVFVGCDKLQIEYETEETTEDATTQQIETTSEMIQQTETTPETTKQTETTKQQITPETTKQQITEIQETTVAKVSVARTKVKKVTKKLAAKKAKIVLKKVKGDGYVIKISTTKKFKKKNTVTKKIKKATFTISNKKLKGKKIIYVKARAYEIVSGKIYYGKWSKIKRVIIE